jgi:hypothetical protein
MKSMKMKANGISAAISMKKIKINMSIEERNEISSISENNENEKWRG